MYLFVLREGGWKCISDLLIIWKIQINKKELGSILNVKVLNDQCVNIIDLIPSTW